MALPAGYVGLFNILSNRARELGYAMALHGSLKKDMDLMCMPWTEEAVAPERLIERLTDAITFLKVDAMMDEHFHNNPPVFPKSRIDGPEVKPHGRLAWNIQLGGGCFLDISVMPLRPTAVSTEIAESAPKDNLLSSLSVNLGDGKGYVNAAEALLIRN